MDEHQGKVQERHRTARFYRAHLQQSLLEHIPSERIHLAKTFSSITWDDTKRKPLVSFTDGTTAEADLILGADGIHSPVRRFFVPTTAPKWTGWVTFRSVFPFSHVAQIPGLPDEATHIWGLDRSLFVSRLGKDLFTVVGSHHSDPDALDATYQDSTWDEDGDVNVLRQYYKSWSPLNRAIIDKVPHTRIYPNTAAEGLQTWVLGNGRVTLAGDAAHAHGGAFAAGGSLAIDDAWAFAASIFHVFPLSSRELPSAKDIERGLKLYERTRKSHTDRVLSTVRGNNQRTLDRIRMGKTENDEELRMRMKNRTDTSWIHEHSVEDAFANALRIIPNL